MYSEKTLNLSIRSSKTTYQLKEQILIDIELRNISNENIYILKNIFPEGWLISINIKDKQGIHVYNSPIIKIEMTATMLETIQLEKDYFYGARFVIEKTFNPGEYTLEVTYSTKPLLKRQDINVPIGMWESNVIKIKILEE